MQANLTKTYSLEYPERCENKYKKASPIVGKGIFHLKIHVAKLFLHKFLNLIVRNYRFLKGVSTGFF
jgi:hypothetical protein